MLKMFNIKYAAIRKKRGVGEGEDPSPLTVSTIDSFIRFLLDLYLIKADVSMTREAFKVDFLRFSSRKEASKGRTRFCTWRWGLWDRTARRSRSPGRTWNLPFPPPPDARTAWCCASLRPPRQSPCAASRPAWSSLSICSGDHRSCQSHHKTDLRLKLLKTKCGKTNANSPIGLVMVFYDWETKSGSVRRHWQSIQVLALGNDDEIQTWHHHNVLSKSRSSISSWAHKVGRHVLGPH